MARIIEKTKEMWLTSSTVNRLIAVNVVVFLALRISAAANIFTADRSIEAAALRLVELPADFGAFIAAPWTIISYMFSQFEVIHLLLNMLWLYWFGMFLSDIFSGRRIMSLYLAGGIVGAVTFMACGYLLPAVGTSGVLIGSSASVLAIVVSCALLMPDREIGLMFIGGIRIKWIALVMIILDFINIGTGNTGGHLAHLGGALTGVAFALHLRYRSALAHSRPANPSAPLRRPSPGVADPASASSSPLDGSDEAVMDMLLDKIRHSGFSSLSSRERERLTEISSNLRRESRH